MNNETLYIIIPCYNEEAVLPETSRRLLDICRQIETGEKILCRILFVDDGSKDATWQIIQSLCEGDCNHYSGLKLAHNVGHQYALWAGMDQIADNCVAVVSIDADLQDDEKVIIEMVKKLKGGKDVVYGVRKERESDSFFKRNTAQFFYKLMKRAGSEIVYNHADFRLLSHRALKALLSYPERNLFIRGLIPQLGFEVDYVYYNRSPRFAGKSKYPFGKMLHFAMEGITSFSIKPLYLIMLSGFAFVIISVLIIVYALWQHFVGQTVAGWTSILVSLWFIGGVLLIALGVIGLYLGKIYNEVKRRPRYLIDTRINLSDSNGKADMYRIS